MRQREKRPRVCYRCAAMFHAAVSPEARAVRRRQTEKHDERECTRNSRASRAASSERRLLLRTHKVFKGLAATAAAVAAAAVAAAAAHPHR